MNNYQRQKGIGLLEILIGVTIFAVTLTLAGGVFGGIVKYQKKAEVSRQVDQEVRMGLDAMVGDIRNSAGAKVEITGSSSSGRDYYNFAVLNGFNQVVNSGGIKLNVALSQQHQRSYFLSSANKLVVQDRIKEGDSWSPWQDQPISGKNIEITELEFDACHGIKAPLGQMEPENKVYPWVKINITAKYKDPKGRPELDSEFISLETVVSPRNFDFWY
jgi:type II secretory pathway pseudopilin PulG